MGDQPGQHCVASRQCAKRTDAATSHLMGAGPPKTGTHPFLRSSACPDCSFSGSPTTQCAILGAPTRKQVSWCSVQLTPLKVSLGLQPWGASPPSSWDHKRARINSAPPVLGVHLLGFSWGHAEVAPRPNLGRPSEKGQPQRALPGSSCLGGWPGPNTDKPSANEDFHKRSVPSQFCLY